MTRKLVIFYLVIENLGKRYYIKTTKLLLIFMRNKQKNEQTNLTNKKERCETNNKYNSALFCFITKNHHYTKRVVGLKEGVLLLHSPFLFLFA